MDARVGSVAVTPRNGKPVEINALWHGALCLTAEWAEELADPAAAELRAEADQVRESFRTKFWNPDRACLYDVLADDGPVKKLRPNQIFAVSLPHGLLAPAHQRCVVRAVQQELLTPFGLRTLELRDPEYKPRYEGTASQRDAAYHQGTVWPGFWDRLSTRSCWLSEKPPKISRIPAAWLSGWRRRRPGRDALAPSRKSTMAMSHAGRGDAPHRPGA